MKNKEAGGEELERYLRRMHGGELWAKIEVLEKVSTPLLKNI